MVIIFCRIKRRVDDLEVIMYNCKYNCVKIYSDIL